MRNLAITDSCSSTNGSGAISCWLAPRLRLDRSQRTPAAPLAQVYWPWTPRRRSCGVRAAILTLLLRLLAAHQPDADEVGRSPLAGSLGGRCGPRWCSTRWMRSQNAPHGANRSRQSDRRGRRRSPGSFCGH